MMCECGDSHCPAHFKESTCNRRATVRLYRVDMEDRSGNAFCLPCAEDAMESGVFRRKPKTVYLRDPLGGKVAVSFQS